MVEQTQEDGPRYLVRRGRSDQSERARSASHCPYLRTYCASSHDNKREAKKDLKCAGSLSSLVCNSKVISGQQLTLRLQAPRHRLRSHRILHVSSTAGQSPQLLTAIDDTKEFCSILKVLEIASRARICARVRGGRSGGRAVDGSERVPREEDGVVCARSGVSRERPAGHWFTCLRLARGKRFSRGKRDSDRPRCLEPLPRPTVILVHLGRSRWALRHAAVPPTRQHAGTAHHQCMSTLYNTALFFLCS